MTGLLALPGDGQLEDAHEMLPPMPHHPGGDTPSVEACCWPAVGVCVGPRARLSGWCPWQAVVWCGLTSGLRGPVKGVAVPQSTKTLVVCVHGEPAQHAARLHCLRGTAAWPMMLPCSRRAGR